MEKTIVAILLIAIFLFVAYKLSKGIDNVFDSDMANLAAKTYRQEHRKAGIRINYSIDYEGKIINFFNEDGNLHSKTDFNLKEL